MKLAELRKLANTTYTNNRSLMHAYRGQLTVRFQNKVDLPHFRQVVHVASREASFAKATNHEVIHVAIVFSAQG